MRVFGYFSIWGAEASLVLFSDYAGQLVTPMVDILLQPKERFGKSVDWILTAKG
jgi:hypothetical protein